MTNVNKKGFATGFILGALAGMLGALVLYKKRRQLKKLWWRAEAKAEIYRRLEGAKRLTRPFYDEVIDEVLADYEAAGDVASEELERFAAKLKGRYDEIRAKLAEAAAADDAQEKE